ncbi:MAG: hypothetical protein ACE5KE_06455 [Methanosarcinales archaeon]
MEIQVGEYYRKKGFRVTYEYKLGEGKSVDIVADKDRKRIAIEIETGKSDTIYNIRKDLDCGFDKVISIAIKNKIKEKILLELKKSGLDNEKRIKLLAITEFFPLTEREKRSGFNNEN